jgi:NAD(P)H-dependent FMN reductase
VKIYVAGRWTRKAEVREAQRLLREAGHEITHDWTPKEDPDPAWDERRVQQYLAEEAREDLRGVREADAVVVLHDDTGRGLFVEFGAALADPRKRVLVVDAAPHVGSCVFYFLPGVEVVSRVEAVVERLRWCDAPTVPEPSPSMLLQADTLIHGDRHDKYGSVTESFARIADAFNALHRGPFTAESVALLLVCMKLTRRSYSPGNRDHLLDAAGYLGLLADVAEAGPRGA